MASRFKMWRPDRGSVQKSNPQLLTISPLEAKYTRLVKCIYIDPPFNTGEMFDNYDDGVEHSLWLSQMRDRLEILHKLLTPDGTLFVHIDDNELAYLVVLLDEIFGRKNKLYFITFKQGAATGHKAINPGCVNTTNFILIYCKEKEKWNPARLFIGRERDTRYGQYIINYQDDYRTWRFTTLVKAFAASRSIDLADARKKVKENPSDLDNFVLDHPESVIRTARPDYDAVSEAARQLIDISQQQPKEIFKLERESNSDMYFKDGERLLFYKDKLKLIDGKYVAGEPLTTLWDDLLSNNLHNEGGVAFPKGKKPEHLLKRVLELCTEKGDIVLDSFAGSGTTGAVAHKMGRRWIMVELGEHCHTHIIPRLNKVIDGLDQSGVTETMNWKGGGGYRYYRIAPSLLEKDKWDNWIINKEYNATMLAEAVCKLEGFEYDPSDSTYWMQGHSTETDYIYVTTQNLSREQLSLLSEEVGEKRSLLVMCSAFRAKVDEFTNLTIRKIPNAVLSKCEWGHDDYSLQVENLPNVPKPAKSQPDLFGDAE